MSTIFSASDVIASLALVVSAYAAWRTIQFNERQKSLIKSQESLNERLLAREEIESINDMQADLRASFLNTGYNNYKLQILNRGKATAHNITIEFPEGNHCVIESEISTKFPLESLGTHETVELIAAINLGSKRKLPLTLIWSDEFSEDNRKTVYPTF